MFEPSSIDSGTAGMVVTGVVASEFWLVDGWHLLTAAEQNMIMFWSAHRPKPCTHVHKRDVTPGF